MTSSSSRTRPRTAESILYVGELEPPAPLEARTCAICKCFYATRRRGDLCAVCHNQRSSVGLSPIA